MKRYVDCTYRERQMIEGYCIALSNICHMLFKIFGVFGVDLLTADEIPSLCFVQAANLFFFNV